MNPVLNQTFYACKGGGNSNVSPFGFFRYYETFPGKKKRFLFKNIFRKMMIRVRCDFSGKNYLVKGCPFTFINVFASKKAFSELKAPCSALRLFLEEKFFEKSKFSKKFVLMFSEEEKAVTESSRYLGIRVFSFLVL